MKKIIKYILIFLSYFIYSSLIIKITNLIGIDFKHQNTIIKNIYLFLTDFLYLLFLFFINKKDLKDEFKKFNFNLFTNYLPIYILGILLMGISNMIVINITGIQLSSNEQGIRSMIKIFPIYMLYSSVIDAPFVEEIIFRKCFRKIFSDDLLFILFSSITFGLIHVINTGNESINELLMGLPYIIMGIDFAYIYYKSKNIFTTISIHSFHNFILMIIQLIGG